MHVIQYLYWPTLRDESPDNWTVKQRLRFEHICSSAFIFTPERKQTLHLKRRFPAVYLLFVCILVTAHQQVCSQTVLQDIVHSAIFPINRNSVNNYLWDCIIIKKEKSNLLNLWIYLNKNKARYCVSLCIRCIKKIEIKKISKIKPSVMLGSLN